MASSLCPSLFTGLLVALPCLAAQAQSAPAVPASPAASSPSSAARFKLTEVRFSPTVAIATPELKQVVQPFIGRDIGANELPLISAAIRKLYEERGFGLVGIGFPSQALGDGVLQVAIVEPTITRVSVDSPAKPPVSQARTERVLSGMGIRRGQPLDLLQLDRAMFTLNDWPGVTAKATLTPGGDEGSYSVAVLTEPGRAWDASIDFDNHGSESSGRYRVGTLLRWNNPLRVGDNLDLRAMVSSGAATTVGRLGYEVPLGATPLRLGAGFSRVSYELAGVFAGTQALGSADVFDVSLSYPLWRTREHNLVSRIALEDKSLSDEFGTTTDKHIRALSAMLSFESRDALLGGGFNGGSGGVQFGKLTDETTTTGSNVDATALGSFRKLSLQLTRLQAINRSLSVFVGMAGQWSNKNLDSAEKFTLGGSKGVRAYPAAEAAADEGLVLNSELRWWMNPGWTSYVFFDAGHAKLQKTPTLAAGDNTRSLRGYGIGLQYSNPQLFTLKATLGVRGSEVVQSEEDSRSRLLVQVQRSF